MNAGGIGALRLLPGGFPYPRQGLVAAVLAASFPSSAAAADAASCIDESETGCALAFEDEAPGVVRIRVREEHADDYPGFAVEPRPGDAAPVRFLVGKTGRRLEPEVLVSDHRWAALPVEPAGDSLRSFAVETGGRRTVIRLWDPERGRFPDALLDLEETHPGASRGGFEAPGGQSGAPAPRPLGAASSCREACYSPRNLFCYDFERLACHVNSIADHPFARVTILGWSRPCPGRVDHVPRAIYKLRITDPTAPRSEKARIVLTGRVHGGERISSFVIEGLIDYALGRPIDSPGGSGLPSLPQRPTDLLRRLEIVVYPMLNPDGSADLDGDGRHDYSRYKCGIDMNRRWGLSEEKTEAYEIHLVHQDILAEAALHPFSFHRDFHDWSKGFQGGFRHGPGTFRDETGQPGITVGADYVSRETEYLELEELLIPHRRVENYFVNEIGDGPIPGSARFALFRELGPEGLLTNTSESSYEILDGVVTSNPPYLSGEDVKHEGGWLLLALYASLETPAELAAFIRGDANRDGSVDLSDAVKILLYLFGGTALPCMGAADLDRSSSVEITDVVYLLDYAFRGGPPPPLPFPTRGAPPEGGLGCGGE